MAATKSNQVVIASGASLSDAYDVGPNSKVAGIVMPSAWTAANLTFQVSNDDSTYSNLYDDGGNEVTVTAAASRYIAFDADTQRNFDGVKYLKIRSGTSGSAVTQASERTLVVVVK